MIISVTSPAKINLGLEILGKRPDGFHEIRTILQMIDLQDEVRARFADTAQLTCDEPAFANDENLALRAATLWSNDIDPRHRHLVIDLRKRIPAAAGLGGASSNAASVLRLADELAHRAGTPRPEDGEARLHALAAHLGSDVPFFLAGPAAIAHGRGELLVPVPALRDTLIVLAVPDIVIAGKTAAMYGALDPQRDFSDGAIVAETRQRLESGAALSGAHLHNAFARPLRALYPEVERIADIMGFYADGRFGLSGAGPGWFALVESDAAAQELAGALARNVPSARIVTGRPLLDPPSMRTESGA